MHSSKNEFICSFFGRIHGLIICFRNELTFSKNIHKMSKGSPNPRLRSDTDSMTCFISAVDIRTTFHLVTLVDINGSINNSNILWWWWVLSMLIFGQLLTPIRGHSTTFAISWTPHLVHVVIEWPLTKMTIIYNNKCLAILSWET